MTDKEIQEKAVIYTDEECIDVIDSRMYAPSDIKHLIRETYKDGLKKGLDKWNELEKEIRDKLWLSTGQTVEKREYQIIGEIIAYKMEIV